ncbi:P-type conjugative transfer ATPase TrbB [Lelliottia aquatilis]|uniref:P-type conjugative transfer ATPase TrbB n=1 Tax=Lelliottia aquatilis TaxID=2080838 RepID=UPI001575B3F6|nr:P-type conjugative transfer ATPase TrbB [Lelliottia aquatilis]NTZ47706.1 P-type conjugative transfer ATPase TrbB [Lelliottia aquatilis]
MSDKAEAQERQIRSLKSHLSRAGILPFIENDNVIEVMLNPDQSLWIEEFGKPMYETAKIAPNDAAAIMNAIAHYHDVLIDRDRPVLECELPVDGSRFEGTIPPLVANPSFTIRKKATRIFTLADYLGHNILTRPQFDVLTDVVAQRKNILIVGGTGSGKTTLANAMIDAMVNFNADDRFLILEDTNEIQCSAQNHVIMRTSERAGIGMRQLLRITLRYRPDRILIGEVRGGEALDLLKAWNTGHPGGLCTIHADSAALALERLEQCVEEVSVNVNRKMIASTIHCVVFIKKTPQGRRIEEVLNVTGYENGQYQFNKVA